MDACVSGGRRYTLNIVYNTPLDKLRAIPGAVKEIVVAQPRTRFNHCHFLTYGDWALRFEVVYFVTVGGFRRVRGHPADHQPRHLRAVRADGRRVCVSVAAVRSGSASGLAGTEASEGTPWPLDSEG